MIKLCMEMEFLKRGDEGHGQDGLGAAGVRMREVGFFDGRVEWTELKIKYIQRIYIII